MCLRSDLDLFDRASGNGSRARSDDWLDESSIFHNEWGSQAATTFDPADTDYSGNKLSNSRQQEFETLYSWHNGKGSPGRKGQIRWSHITNDANIFMSVLEMPEYQRKRVLHILEEIDISSNNFGRAYEEIILGLCSLIADESLGKRPNPNIEDRLFLTDVFQELMETVDMSSRELRKVREQIRQEADYF